MKASATAAEIADEVRAGRIKARAVAEAALARIDKHNAMLGAFTDVTARNARSTPPMRWTARWATGIDPGPLAGVPFAVKNLFDIRDVVTRAGSKINRDNPPASRDATLVTKMEAAGAVLVGGAQHGRICL